MFGVCCFSANLLPIHREEGVEEPPPLTWEELVKPALAGGVPAEMLGPPRTRLALAQASTRWLAVFSDDASERSDAPKLDAADAETVAAVAAEDPDEAGFWKEQAVKPPAVEEDE